MKKLLVILLLTILITLIPSSVLAWNPWTHGKLGVDVSKQVVVADYNAFIAGNVIPDLALAYDQTDYTKHTMFHSQTYFNNLKLLAIAPDQKDLVRGWQVHLIGDPIENAYRKAGAPWSAGVACEAFSTTRPRYITVSSNLQNLIIQAWNLTYPSYPWKPDSTYISRAVNVTNAYLRFWFPPVSYFNAIKWYPDYNIYFQKTIDQSLLLIKGG